MISELPKDCRLIPLPVHGDSRGSLVALESDRHIPFAISRVFYIYATGDKVERGHHAHHTNSEVAVAVSGSCIMSLDDGNSTVDVRLDHPSKGLTIAPMIWRVMKDFTPDCILLVLTDAPYDEADYIRDYDAFLHLARA